MEINNKIVACVTDNTANESSNKTVGWEHFPCIALTLNLIVRDSLETIQNIIKKVKCISNHFECTLFCCIVRTRQYTNGEKSLALCLT